MFTSSGFHFRNGQPLIFSFVWKVVLPSNNQSSPLISGDRRTQVLTNELITSYVEEELKDASVSPTNKVEPLPLFFILAFFLRYNKSHILLSFIVDDYYNRHVSLPTQQFVREQKRSFRVMLMLLLQEG
jgi:hypothetical protein